MGGNCESCQECVHIGDGDYACMEETPSRIVLTDFGTATEDYMWCKGGNGHADHQG